MSSESIKERKNQWSEEIIKSESDLTDLKVGLYVLTLFMVLAAFRLFAL